MKVKKDSKISDLRHNSESGAMMVEVSLSIIAFLALIILTFDTVRLASTAAQAQFAASTALRKMVINTTEDTTTRTTEFNTAVSEAITEAGLRAADTTSEFTALDVTDFVNGDAPVPANLVFSNTTAEGGELISITITSTVDFVFGAFSFDVSGTAMGRAELTS